MSSLSLDERGNPNIAQWEVNITLLIIEIKINPAAHVGPMARVPTVPVSALASVLVPLAIHECWPKSALRIEPSAVPYNVLSSQNAAATNLIPLRIAYMTTLLKLPRCLDANVSFGSGHV